MKSKSFLDPVHGYINIPEDICDKIIDTANFQRLRRVEQTSARTLFPGARHDRFIHSLGVYHIGCKISRHIVQNSENLQSVQNLETIVKSYELACLLHDCGHAPFSHTFESYYDSNSILSTVLKECYDDEYFTQDLEGPLMPAAPHEILSAIIVLKVYSKTICELGGDPQLVARMITGYRYMAEDDKGIENCFISLLNGQVIDADRIDYVCRDRWASGYKANTLDIERLVGAMSICKHDNKDIVCFNKGAMYEIQSVIDMKDFQQMYVFTHHKIVYDQFILKKAIEEVAMFLSPNEDSITALNMLFNYNTMLETVNLATCKIYLPADDDLVFLMKQCLITKNNSEEHSYAKEWLNREHVLIPLWKSQAEFLSFFDGILPDHLTEAGWLFKRSGDVIQKFIKDEFPNRKLPNCIFSKATPKIKIIKPNQIHVKIGNKLVCYSKLITMTKKQVIDFFFYIFVPAEIKPRKLELIEHLVSHMKRINQ
ncbi:MAG: HD domain-containing protein [Prevotellaceae bacterium]|jgi:HD superfamily phosphohydrolase|nr:HD domain-containing protein [Prevotellaceae bacterium]